MESLGTLAGGIAHDFNNILGAIFGGVELLKSDINNANPEYVNLIADASLRAKELINQILTFSREKKVEMVDFKSTDTVLQAISFIKYSTPLSIHFECAVNSDSSVRGDETQFHQVIMNILTNAVKAMPKGGSIKVSISDSVPSRLQIDSYSLSPILYQIISISDSGCGMSEQTMEKIFEPYFSTRSGEDKGNGIGLALAKSIIGSMGGNIGVESIIGSGTKFTIFIPIC